jgi:hypothetical protein
MLRTQVLAICAGLAVVYVGSMVFEPFALTAMRGDPEEALKRLIDALLMPYNVMSEVGLGSGIGTMFAGLQDLGVQLVGEGFDEGLDRGRPRACTCAPPTEACAPGPWLRCLCSSAPAGRSRSTTPCQRWSTLLPSGWCTESSAKKEGCARLEQGVWPAR